MDELSHRDAVLALAALRVVRMGPRERSAHLVEYLARDQEDLEEQGFTKAQISAFFEHCAAAGASSGAARPFLIDSYATELAHARGAYLEDELMIHGLKCRVVGGAPRTFKCPCCEYSSLPNRSDYDVCSVCGWEDDGTVDDRSVSAANRATLGEARAAFRQHGTAYGRPASATQLDARRRYAGPSEVAE